MSGRFPPIPDPAMSAAQKRLTEEVGEAKVGPYLAFLRSPELRRTLQPVRTHLRDQPNIGLDAQELAILMVARHWRSRVAFASHVPLARRAGLADDVIQALGEGARPALDGVLGAVHDFCAQLLAGGQVSDDVFERARDTIGEQGVVDLTGIVGFYTTISLVLNVDGQASASPVPF